MSKEEFEGKQLFGSIHKIALRHVIDRNGRWKVNRYIPGPTKPGFYPEEFISTRIGKGQLKKRFSEAIEKYEDLFRLSVGSELDGGSGQVFGKRVVVGLDKLEGNNKPKNGGSNGYSK